ncbi:MAG: TAXI family TRAP transporter solute-binding subunit [Epsilonproteobacteria bacterium]|jgi:TRAP transporter TAXI family solute receptor|nr:TAXI family TRAP transporter solute-binding subunit [Campylobacterota bacterium]
MKKLLIASLATAAMSMSLFGAKFITIGTGGVTGVYYPTGGAICRMVNKMKKETGIRCSVESTGGSVYNVNTINAGELDFGIAQSDVVYQAYHGTGKFKGKPIKKLRTLMTIYPELLTLAVRKDSGIKKIHDIIGKRINIGNPGSGQRNTVEVLFKESPVLSFDKLKAAEELRAAECPNALKDNQIDGYFYVVGHPSANFKDAANSVPIDFINIDEKDCPAVAKILKKYPYYAKGVIPKGLYKGIDHDTTTFGVKATLVTTADMDDKVVTAVLKAILDNFEEFKKLHPAYKTITKESLVQGLGAPLHPAAEAYFKKIGILK